MASLTSVNFNSDSDSDDDDYVPDQAEASDDDLDAVTKKASTLKTKRSEGGIRLEDDDIDFGTLEAKEKEAQKRKKAFEAEHEEIRLQRETKRSEDLWADFKKDTKHTQSAKQSVTKGSSNNLGGKPKPKTTSVPVKKVTSQNVISSIFDAFETKDGSKLSLEETKPDVDPRKSIVSSIFDQMGANKTSQSTSTPEETKGDDGAKVKITKLYDFAGENVEVSKVVDATSKEGQKYLKQRPDGHEVKKRPPGKGGLGGLLNAISKKPKMGCLDKSKMDWDKFVVEEGIKEDLETFNKGKDGYVEKQMFLERADHRRFDLEKAAREKTRKPLNR